MLPLRYGWLWLAGGFGALLVILWLAMARIGGLPVRGSDKVLHVLAFVFLTVWFLGVFKWRRATLVAGMLVGYGLLIELLQSTTAYRMADPYDVLADAIGIGGGWLLAAAGLRHWCGWLETLLGVGAARNGKG